MRQGIRLWAAAGMVLAASLGTQWVRSGYSHEVRAPSKDVRGLPGRLGVWEAAEDRPLEKRTANVLGADAYVGRVYRTPDGGSASVQVAVWTDHSEGPTAVHYPELCYRNAGWELSRTEAAEVRLPGGAAQPLRLMQMDRQGAKIVTAHWYRMGDATFFSKDEARAVHRGLWGRREWPCVVKVLIQVSADDIESARPELEDLAGAVAAWTESLR